MKYDELIELLVSHGKRIDNRYSIVDAQEDARDWPTRSVAIARQERELRDAHYRQTA